MIPVARPDVSQKELNQIQEAFESGWIGLGPKVDEFESKFAEQFGYGHVVGTNSCTNALDLALKAPDLSGDEVLVPPITWISTAFAAIYNDYDVGWVDVNPETLNMSPEALKERISADTAAVIVVHYGGQPGEVSALAEIAHDHGAILVEDCAHAPGATVEDQPVGTVGDIGCFSFQATKPLTTGEGGALVTDDEELANRIKRLSKLGVNKSTHERSEESEYSWYYEVTDVGYKYFMNDIAAGMGMVQLDRLPDTRQQRNEVADAYNNSFADVDWVIPLHEKPHATHARYNYTIRVPADHRDSIIGSLAQDDIGATVHYMPLYKHPVFDHHDVELPVTENVWEQIVTLPMSSTFSEEEVSTVIDAVVSYGDDKSLFRPEDVSLTQIQE